jgi:hypothetical protein
VSSTAQEGHGGGGLRDGGLWRNFDPGWRASATMAQEIRTSDGDNGSGR